MVNGTFNNPGCNRCLRLVSCNVLNPCLQSQSAGGVGACANEFLCGKQVYVILGL